MAGRIEVEKLEGKAKECVNCGKVGPNLLRCSRCRNEWYCSLKCHKSYWPFHKERCRRNELADAVSDSDPKFATWLREHGKQAIIKDAEVERLERASRAVSGPSRQEVMDGMYGRLRPLPQAPTYSLEESSAVARRNAQDRAQALLTSPQEAAWRASDFLSGLGADCGSYKWRQNQSHVEVFAKLPLDLLPISAPSTSAVAPSISRHASAGPSRRFKFKVLFSNRRLEIFLAVQQGSNGTAAPPLEASPYFPLLTNFASGFQLPSPGDGAAAIEGGDREEGGRGEEGRDAEGEGRAEEERRGEVMTEGLKAMKTVGGSIRDSVTIIAHVERGEKSEKEAEKSEKEGEENKEQGKKNKKKEKEGKNKDIISQNITPPFPSPSLSLVPVNRQPPLTLIRERTTGNYLIPLLMGNLFQEIVETRSSWTCDDTGILHVRLLKKNRRGHYLSGSCNSDTFWWSVLSEQSASQRIPGRYPPLNYYNSPYESDTESQSSGSESDNFESARIVTEARTAAHINANATTTTGGIHGGGSNDDGTPVAAREIGTKEGKGKGGEEKKAKKVWEKGKREEKREESTTVRQKEGKEMRGTREQGVERGERNEEAKNEQERETRRRYQKALFAIE